jgi:hypothetical protein
MQLPGRLKATTLGDLLGAIHRSASTGTLELKEPNGRVHRVYVAGGLVTAVDIDRATASLAEILRREDTLDEETLRRSLLRALATRRLHGEVLVRDFHLSDAVVGRALRRQVLLRLSVLEELGDAQICFRVTLRPPRGALTDAPLGASEFLRGRRRARDSERAPVSAGTVQAYRELGLPSNAVGTEVKQAYRRLARAYHPDLHPHASPAERSALSARFSSLTKAYRTLVA